MNDNHLIKLDAILTMSYLLGDLLSQHQHREKV
jgi:hypothetical protein